MNDRIDRRLLGAGQRPLGFGGGCFTNGLVDVPLLEDRQHVVDHPIEDQTRGEKGKEPGEHDGEELHDFRLQWVRWWRAQSLLDEHRDTHQEGQDEIGVFRGEIRQPADKGCLAHLDGFNQHPVE